jgi:tRNA pseudouridine38-40 synthase
LRYSSEIAALESKAYMARYQVILAYDGTEFRGYQKQTGARTVQGVFEQSLRKLGWLDRSVLAAGRTDTGVHATGQVLAFNLEWRHSDGDLLRALNADLPADVAVRDLHHAAPDFHPRYDAVSRWYRYHLFCEPVRDPLRERFAWRVWPAVDLEVLNLSAMRLLGRHDFAAFGSPPRLGGSTTRTVSRAHWMEASGQTGVPLIIFEIAADAFLYHMVRRLVSLQVEIGQKVFDREAIRGYLDGEESMPVQGIAPAHGLVLSSVRYQD